ncbi:MAG TPA: CDP-alcohol phosphatidyltransferase family protein [Kofleriaceae bacterium]|nr:CDP-alcohol phosphatidyltransferase family protein [Kofleriaceae bacterium]
MRSVINPANAITAARFFALPAFWIWIDGGLIQWALLAVIYCGVLDLFDGAVARAFNCTSAFGELFDAIADGICYAFFVIILAAYDRVPLWTVIAVMILGGINALFRAIYARRAGRATNYRSFAMERVVAYAAYLAGFGTAGYEVDFYYSMFVVVLFVVVAHDAKRMLIDPVPPAAEPAL